MGKRIEMYKGQRFGRLIIKDPNPIIKNGKGISYFLCICDCGNEIIVQGKLLRSGHTKSCGCLNLDKIHERAAKNINKSNINIGDRFGRLTVIGFVGVINKRSHYLCKCDCGSKIIATGNALKSGNTKSCGCLNLDKIHERAVNKDNINIGDRFGRLVIIGSREVINGHAWHICKCDCGSETKVRDACLNNGNTKSCGCYRLEKLSEANKIKTNINIGDKFGYWTVIGPRQIIDSSAWHLCRCKCGNERMVWTGNLNAGNTKSCGCCKFISQTELCNIIKELCLNDVIVGNYRLPCLDGQHFDIFNITRNFAVEYDGEGHFRPVKFNGISEERAIENFKKTQERDALKNKKAMENGIILVRFDYTENENLTPEYVKQKLIAHGVEFPNP